MDGPEPTHFHAYRWQGDRRDYDREAERRPGARWGEPPSAAFLANRCTPLQVNHWLLRPASAVNETLPDASQAATWFRAELEAVASSLSGGEGGAERVGATVAHVAETLLRGGDVHRGWYLPGAGYLTLDIIGCSVNRSGPDLPCPLR